MLLIDEVIEAVAGPRLSSRVVAVDIGRSVSQKQNRDRPRAAIPPTSSLQLAASPAFRRSS